MRSRTRALAALHVLLTLLLAGTAAQLCVWLRTPLLWMIGPLLATAFASILGVPTASWIPLRNAAQMTIASALGLYFTPAMAGLLAGLWWAVLLGVAWSLVLGWAFGRWLDHVYGMRIDGPAGVRSATTYFAGAIGGASEMTLLAERDQARTDLVAAAHSLRVLIVTVVVPFALTFSGLHGVDLTPPGPREVHWGGLALLGAACLAGVVLMRLTGRANPWFVGALAVSIGLTTGGVFLSAIPQWMSNAAQLLIGVSLGVRFTADFIHAAPRWLGFVAVGTLGLILLCAVFAWLLALGTGLHPATMILGTSPGGIAEMAITAKVLQMGVPVVTAFQVCRLVAVLVLVEPLYRRLHARRGALSAG